jgi:hypothetical protein
MLVVLVKLCFEILEHNHIVYLLNGNQHYYEINSLLKILYLYIYNMYSASSVASTPKRAVSIKLNS